MNVVYGPPLLVITGLAIAGIFMGILLGAELGATAEDRGDIHVEWNGSAITMGESSVAVTYAEDVSGPGGEFVQYAAHTFWWWVATVAQHVANGVYASNLALRHIQAGLFLLMTGGLFGYIRHRRQRDDG